MKIDCNNLKNYYLDFFGMGLISLSYFLPVVSFHHLGQNFFVFSSETYLKYLIFSTLIIYPFLKLKKNLLFQKLFCIIMIFFLIFISPKVSYSANRFGVIPNIYCGGIIMTETGFYFILIGLSLIFVNTFKENL